MKNSKKYLLIILVVSALLFTGCTDLLIDAHITDDNLVTMTYNMSFEGTREDDDMHDSLMDFLYELTEHWQESGYEADIRIEKDVVNVYCYMQKQCETREQAFEALHEFMTNDITLFDKVDYTYNQDFYKEDYSISAYLDISNMIDENVYTEYPMVVGEDIDKIIEDAEVVVRFTLPYDDTPDDNMLNEKVFEQKVVIGEPAVITAEGIINNYENIKTENDLLSEKVKQQKTLMVLAGAAFLAVAGLVAVLVLGRKKKAKKEEAELEEEKESE